MPKGPRGEKRPADLVGNAVKVMRLATGEETEDLPSQPVLQRAKKGAAARTVRLSDAQRAEIARTAAEARWRKSEG